MHYLNYRYQQLVFWLKHTYTSAVYASHQMSGSVDILFLLQTIYATCTHTALILSLFDLCRLLQACWCGHR